MPSKSRLALAAGLIVGGSVSAGLSLPATGRAGSIPTTQDKDRYAEGVRESVANADRMLNDFGIKSTLSDADRVALPYRTELGARMTDDEYHEATRHLGRKRKPTI